MELLCLFCGCRGEMYGGVEGSEDAQQAEIGLVHDDCAYWLKYKGFDDIGKISLEYGLMGQDKKYPKW